MSDIKRGFDIKCRFKSDDILRWVDSMTCKIAQIRLGAMSSDQVMWLQHYKFFLVYIYIGENIFTKPTI